MNRRRLVQGVLGGMLPGAVAGGVRPAAAQAPSLASTWPVFRDRFMADDGRIRDTGNGDVSHTEGQGYGMLLAAAADDRPAFERLWRWTRDNLAVRADGLLAWRWVPQGPERLPDLNNATDGEILIAWALLRGGGRWRDAEMIAASAALARRVRELLVLGHRIGPVLLPAREGFLHADGVTVNLSYWLFPAFPALARIDPHPVWEQLDASGLRLLREARFGLAQLPPDWLSLGPPLRPADPFPPVFGYNAIRIPLHLRWAGLDDAAILEPFRRLWRADGARAATVDLTRGNAPSDPASSGLRAIAAFTLWRPGEPAPSLPPLQAHDDYYSSVLVMLTGLAMREAAT